MMIKSQYIKAVSAKLFIQIIGPVSFIQFHPTALATCVIADADYCNIMQMHNLNFPYSLAIKIPNYVKNA